MIQRLSEELAIDRRGVDTALVDARWHLVVAKINELVDAENLRRLPPRGANRAANDNPNQQ